MVDRDRGCREVEEKLKRAACHIIEHAARMAEAAPAGLALEVRVPRFGLPVVHVSYDVVVGDE